MPDKEKEKETRKEAEAGTFGRLSKAGEDALTRLVEELGKNERVTDAIARAASAKGKLDQGAKRAVGQVGLAAADELKDLRKHIERLEKRLAKLESEAKPATKPRTTKAKPTTRAKKTAEKPSPAPGRSIGGGTGRGSGSGGTTST
jgi:polyhydroxyalkanoate synthesis regulator phasin